MPSCRTLPSYLLRFLSEPWEAVLSTINPSGLPQQTVMWFALQEGHIVMTCLRNRVKVRNLEQNPRASALFVGPGCYASVSGEVNIVSDLALAQRNLEVLLKRYTEPEKTAVMLGKLTQPNRVTLLLKPEQYHTHRIRSWLEV